MTRRHSHAHYGQKIKVNRVIPHPHYNDAVAHDNDIALFQVRSPCRLCTRLENLIFYFRSPSLFLQLATRVAFHDHLLPVCLPPTDMKELAAGTRCTVIGWGKKEDKNRELKPYRNLHYIGIRFLKQKKLFLCLHIDRNSISVWIFRHPSHPPWKIFRLCMVWRAGGGNPEKCLWNKLRCVNVRLCIWGFSGNHIFPRRVLVHTSASKDDGELQGKSWLRVTFEKPLFELEKVCLEYRMGNTYGMAPGAFSSKGWQVSNSQSHRIKWPLIRFASSIVSGTAAHKSLDSGKCSPSFAPT